MSMEDSQAADGERFSSGMTGFTRSAGTVALAERLRKNKKDHRVCHRSVVVRALTSKQTKGKTGNPFKAGLNTMNQGNNEIAAANTGRRGSNLSTAPIPIPPPRKVPYENAQAGPSRPRAEPQIIAGSRRKLNLNHTEASEDDFSIQDPGE